MKCIIYGLGSGRLRVERYLKKEYEIVGYSDSFYMGKEFCNKRFYKVDELIDIEFDFIVLSIGSLDIANEIEKKLISLGINENKIVNFYRLYKRNTNIYREVINCEKHDYESIILGLSNSFMGISKKDLKYKPLKLSAPMQDLFYNLMKLEQYSGVIKQCKSIIIDMYTYTYFNYDVSMSFNAVDYILQNDFKNIIHNFKKNKNYKINLHEEIVNEIRILKEMFNFNNINVLEDNIESGAIDKESFDFINKKSLSLNDEVQTGIPLGLVSSIQKRIYTDTENENKIIFERILQILKEKNKDIKIYIILIPQYIKCEKLLRNLEEGWKERFYNILNPLKERYKFEILDFKNCEKISSNKEFYCDGGHLNYFGAKEFTNLLNSYLE